MKWSKTGIPLNKAERRAVKAKRRLEKRQSSEIGQENNVPPAFTTEPCSPRYTLHQISIAQKSGLDTSNWNTDTDFKTRQIERASDIFVDSWSNPKGFSAGHLRIPYRFKTENYSTSQMKKMAMWLDEMSGYIDGCIEFYDDTKTKYYSQDYILIRNTDESGANDFGCWSYVGNVR